MANVKEVFPTRLRPEIVAVIVGRTPEGFKTTVGHGREASGEEQVVTAGNRTATGVGYNASRT